MLNHWLLGAVLLFGGNLSSVEKIVPPAGGRIHVATVNTNENRPWAEAVRAAGPDTGKDWDIWKVGNLYPRRQGVSEHKVILVNFGHDKYPTSKEVLAWAKTSHLVPVDPRKIFALAEAHPALDKELGMPNWTTVVSLMPRSFDGEQQVPGVWWRDTERAANLHWFTHGWRDRCWFAFVCE